jgi:tetratricopeptide (TPR) repeat protein
VTKDTVTAVPYRRYLSQNSLSLLTRLPFAPLLLRKLGLDWQACTQRAREAFRIGDYEECERQHEIALAVAHCFGAKGECTSHSLNSLGVVSLKQAKVKEGQKYCEAAFNLFACHPETQQDGLATCLSNLGYIHRILLDFEQSERFYLEALQIENAMPDGDKRRSYLCNNLAALYSQQGRYAEAEAFLEQHRSRIERNDGPEHPDMAAYFITLGCLCFRREQVEEAERCFAKSLALRTKTRGLDHPDTAVAYYHWGLIRFKRGCYANAEEQIRRTIQILEKTYALDSYKLVGPLTTLVLLIRRMGREMEANTIAQRVADIGWFM